jgi:hypothetical protein
VVSPESVIASLDVVQAVLITVMACDSGTRGSGPFDCRSRLERCKNFSLNITQPGSTLSTARDP